jgi:hypothetical protein
MSQGAFNILLSKYINIHEIPDYSFREGHRQNKFGFNIFSHLPIDSFNPFVQSHIFKNIL